MLSCEDMIAPIGKDKNNKSGLHNVLNINDKSNWCFT